MANIATLPIALLQLEGISISVPKQSSAIQENRIHVSYYTLTKNLQTYH